ncbi:MAG: gliding motility-associated C-terminal domain-containing protein, partial [Chitinophagaceae bacterium]|nr:gliding motility-associated C-terminal domain-containing protein [Chitinophagaceae bacterium]
VNVVNYITVQAGPDTTICLTDQIILRTNTIASSFSWSPSTTLNNATIKNPIANPTANTTYTVIGNLGRCQATDQITVRVAPYPQVNITTRDTIICYGNRVQLNANYTGTEFRWSPTNALVNTNGLNPLAGPTRNTIYILTVRDTVSGCPKSVRDSVRIQVIPNIIVNAGRDTMIVPDQSLALAATASSGNQFNWTPSLGLNNTTIYNPIVQLGNDIDSILYRVRVTDAGGCYGEDDILVKVLKSQPDILVPSGFTPNGDGKNDILKPIPVGITELQYFRIYNRWGQLLFSTSQQGIGWDGRYNGIPQGSGTYVFVTQGKDIYGKPVFRKGTAVLIR